MIARFPQFSRITLDDGEEYNKFIAEYPPFSDISFTNLHIWWDLDGNLSAAELNGNLVLNYSLPFDKEHSGLGLIGAKKADESIQTIFEYLRSQHRPVKLVNVPEFVVDQIKDKGGLKIEEEPDFHEYVMSSGQLAKLEGADHSRTRRKVNRFLREADEREVELKILDLSSPEIREMVGAKVEDWSKRYARESDPDSIEDDVLKRTLNLSGRLGTHNLCVFVDGELHGIALFHLTPDGRHYILNHLRVDYEISNIFDYLTNQVAIKAAADGVPFLNMEMDLGSEGLKQHKMGLRPVKFFKKFTVEPKT